MLVGIVAVAKDLAIGHGGKLPWHYPADLKFFKRTTTGNTVVMGANTWRSIGKPLPNRTNIVMSRSGSIDLPDGVLLMRSVAEVAEFAAASDAVTYIIGGAGIYAAFEGMIDEWLVTDVPEAVEDADTFMPADFLDDFTIVETIDLGDGLSARRLRRA